MSKLDYYRDRARLYDDWPQTKDGFLVALSDVYVELSAELDALQEALDLAQGDATEYKDLYDAAKEDLDEAREKLDAVKDLV